MRKTEEKQSTETLNSRECFTNGVKAVNIPEVSREKYAEKEVEKMSSTMKTGDIVVFSYDTEKEYKKALARINKFGKNHKLKGYGRKDGETNNLYVKKYA